MNIHQWVTKLPAGVLLAAALALSLPTASYAFGGHEYYYEPSDNGSVWSYYPGYFSHGPADTTTDIPADAHGKAPGNWSGDRDQQGTARGHVLQDRMHHSRR